MPKIKAKYSTPTKLKKRVTSEYKCNNARLVVSVKRLISSSRLNKNLGICQAVH